MVVDRITGPKAPGVTSPNLLSIRCDRLQHSTLTRVRRLLIVAGKRISRPRCAAALRQGRTVWTSSNARRAPGITAPAHMHRARTWAPRSFLAPPYGAPAQEGPRARAAEIKPLRKAALSTLTVSPGPH